MKRLPLLFLALLLLDLAGAALLYKRGIHIQTDLTAMLPASRDAHPEFEAKLTAAASEQILLLLGAEDEDTLDDAGDALNAALAETDQLQVLIDEDRLFDHVLPVFEANRLQLLTASDRRRLANGEAADMILAELRAQRSLAMKLVPYQVDPLGTLNRYIDSVVPKDIAAPSKSWQGKSLLWKVVPVRATDGMSVAGGENLQRWLDGEKAKLLSDNGAVLLATGVPIFTRDATSMARGEINVIGSVSMVAIVLICLLVFRSLQPLLLALFSVASGVVTAFIFCQLAFWHLHLVTLVFGAALTGVAVDFALHFAAHAGRGDILQRIRSPMLLSLLSSVAGYAALLFTGVRGLQEIALFSVVGLIGACLTVLSLGPLLVRRELSWAPRLSLPLNFAIPWRWLAVFICAGAAGMLFARGLLKFDDNPRVMYAAKPRTLEVATFASSLLERETGPYLLISADDEDQLQLELQFLRGQIEQWQRNNLVDEVQWIGSWIPEYATQKHNEAVYREALATRPELLSAAGFSARYVNAFQHELLAQKDHLLKMAELSTALGSAGQSYAMYDRRGVATQVRLLGLKDADAIRKLATQRPGWRFVDRINDLQRALSQLRERALWFLGLSYLLVLLLLRFAHPWRKVLGIVCNPLLASLVCVLGVVAIGHSLSLFHVLGLYLVLGLGVDYSIFMASSAAEDRRTLLAVVVSALTSILAFGLLAFSSTPFVAQFGTTMLVGCSVSVLLAMMENKSARV